MATHNTRKSAGSLFSKRNKKTSSKHSNTNNGAGFDAVQIPCGTAATPFHPNCRCTLVSAREGKSAEEILADIAGFLIGPYANRWQTLSDDPNLYNFLNWLTAGTLDAIKGTFFPEKPLSLQHWMDSLSTATLLFVAYKLIQPKGILGNPENVGNGTVFDDTLDDAVEGKGSLGKLDESLKSFNSLGKDEQRIVTQLLNEGKNVKLIPETPNVGKMYDFLVDGIPTELKTLNGSNINTLVTKVGDALKQIDGSGQIIYDISKAGFTSEQMAEINARLVGKYSEQVLEIIRFVK